LGGPWPLCSCVDLRVLGVDLCVLGVDLCVLVVDLRVLGVDFRFLGVDLCDPHKDVCCEEGEGEVELDPPQAGSGTSLPSLKKYIEGH